MEGQLNGSLDCAWEIMKEQPCCSNLGVTFTVRESSSFVNPLTFLHLLSQLDSENINDFFKKFPWHIKVKELIMMKNFENFQSKSRYYQSNTKVFYMRLKSEWSHFVFLSNLHVNCDLDRGLKRRVGTAGNCLHRMD